MAQLVKTGRRDDDPSVRLDRPRKRRGLPLPVPAKLVTRVLANTIGCERVAVALAATCGLRSAEVAAARPEHLEAGEDGAALVVTGKGGKQRRLPVPAALAVELEQLPPGRPFVVTRAGKPFTAKGCSAMIGRVLRSYQVDASAHQLRHAFATDVYAATGDLLSLSQVLGHADPTTTAIYAKATPKKVRAAGERRPNRLLNHGATA